jgi:hypothetical protein
MASSQRRVDEKYRKLAVMDSMEVSSSTEIENNISLMYRLLNRLCKAGVLAIWPCSRIGAISCTVALCTHDDCGLSINLTRVHVPVW